MQGRNYETKDNKPQLTFAPIVLIRDLLNRWLVVLVTVVLVVVGVYIVCEETYQPVYQTEATLVITSRDTTTTVFSNLNSTKELAAVFSSLLNSSTMQKIVLENLDMSGVRYQIFASAIEETNLMTIRVQSGDPRVAFLVLNTLVENHGVVTYQVMGDVIVEVLQTGLVPVTPINTSASLRNAKVAALLAAILTCLAILFFSYTADKVRSKHEAEKKLTCWCLGEVYHEKHYKTFRDLIAKNRRGLVITGSDAGFRFVETIRKVRRRTEQYMADGKTLMVTSVLENEGKTTIAVNLAMSLAKKHARVLLIDMDLRKPACHKVLNQKNVQKTTMAVLSGRTPLSAAVVREKLSGLYMLLEQSERSYDPKRVTELIASEQVAKLIGEAKEQYDYVVVDLPPMSAEPDAEYVMEHVDASLLVVRQNNVQAKHLNKAISALDKGKAKLLGCVVNDVYASDTGMTVGTGYGYGYSYGEYGSYGNSRKK